MHFVTRGNLKRKTPRKTEKMGPQRGCKKKRPKKLEVVFGGGTTTKPDAVVKKENETYWVPNKQPSLF